MIIAIDGPAGSGKSTVAAALAARLGLPHVDGGAYYRAATLAVLRADVDPADPAACASVLRRVRIERRDGRTYLDGQDVEEKIRGPRVTASVSTVAAHAPVRAAVLELQRAEIGPDGAVIEGRDAGTAVVPNADLKVWLIASPRERALRRALQLGARDPAVITEHVADLTRRDARDAGRMRRARDAVEVDTTGRSVEEVVDQILALLRERERSP